MYDFGDIYDRDILEGSYLNKKSGREEQSSSQRSRAASLEDVNEVLEGFIITADDPDVLRYQKDILRNVNSSEALRAGAEFDEVKRTRSEFSDRQLRNVRFETMPEELAQMDPDTILVQVETPSDVPEGLDEYMEEHGYTRPLAGFSPQYAAEEVPSQSSKFGPRDI